VAEALPFEPFYGTRGHRGEGKARAFEPRSAVLHSLARTGTASAVSAPSYVFEVQFFSDNADDDVAVCDALRRAAGGLAHAVRRADRYERADLCGNQPVRRVRRHRHAIEQASRRWRGGRRDDSARTRRKIFISTQAPTGASPTRSR